MRDFFILFGSVNVNLMTFTFLNQTDLTSHSLIRTQHYSFKQHTYLSSL